MFSQKEKENGISFVQSGLLLYMALLSLSTEVDLETKKEIDTCLMNASSHMVKYMINDHSVTTYLIYTFDYSAKILLFLIIRKK